MKRMLLIMLKVYINFISPFFPPRCRFYPSCSRYCFEAIEKYGVAEGVYFGIRRLLHCHPFNPGGYDPVPDKKK
jgi:hypothetical protein